MLNEAKSQTKKSLEDMRVSHMFIENYQIDKNNYNFFPENYKSNNFSLDVCFIGVPNHIIKEFERVLKKYQIFSTKIISSDYIYSLYPDDNQNITKFIGDGGSLIIVDVQKDQSPLGLLKDRLKRNPFIRKIFKKKPYEENSSFVFHNSKDIRTYAVKNNLTLVQSHFEGHYMSKLFGNILYRISI